MPFLTGRGGAGLAIRLVAHARILPGCWGAGELFRCVGTPLAMEPGGFCPSLVFQFPARMMPPQPVRHQARTIVYAFNAEARTVAPGPPFPLEIPRTAATFYRHRFYPSACDGNRFSYPVIYWKTRFKRWTQIIGGVGA